MFIATRKNERRENEQRMPEKNRERVMGTCVFKLSQHFLSSRLNNNDITTLEATGVFKSLSQLKKM